MNSEPKICVKKKFTKIKNIPLYIIGWFTIIFICFLLFFPYYAKYQFMQECRQENHTAEWCQEVWHELREFD